MGLQGALLPSFLPYLGPEKSAQTLNKSASRLIIECFEAALEAKSRSKIIN
jgi:hypothetical protein